MIKGGWAFPVPPGTYEQKGMTLRDYFAAKAMQALMDWPNEGDDDVAKHAYEIADAMIKARDA